MPEVENVIAWLAWGGLIELEGDRYRAVKAEPSIFDPPVEDGDDANPSEQSDPTPEPDSPPPDPAGTGATTSGGQQAPGHAKFVLSLHLDLTLDDLSKFTPEQITSLMGVMQIMATVRSS